MPTTKSAKKRLRQSLEKRTQNRAVKSELKTRIRNVRESVKSGKLDDANQAMRTLTKRLDQAAAKNVIHSNQSSRTKSRLASLLKNASVAAKT